MRHNQNRRSRSRNRKGPNPLTRSFESNGPDVKVRGTAPHVAEKYMSLARDAQSAGDIVAAENYLQHAEHYNRIVMAAQAQLQQERQPQFGGADDAYDDDRQMNGRGAIRDRFESNTNSDDEEGDDRFDSSEEEQERSFEPPRQQQQPRINDRNGPRGPRQERFDRPRPDQRSDGRGDGRSERSEFRGEGRNEARPDMRNDRSDRPRYDRPDDRGDQRGNDQRGGNEQRADRNGAERPRFDRPDERQERSGRGDRGERPERAAASGPSDEGEARGDAADIRPVPMMPELPLEEDAAAPVRKRRGRPPRVEAGAEAASGDAEVTPDGAAALVAFPE